MVQGSWLILVSKATTRRVRSSAVAWQWLSVCVLAQPAPQRLHRHQVGAVARQGQECDAEAGGFGPHRLGVVVGSAVPDQGERAVRDGGPEPAQHIHRVLAVGARVGPDPHLALVEQIQGPR